ncbi:hypothetical protein D3273_03730 [Lichenibacterium minor]|uniref:Uncharacterized protein n=1 Tax=Lichenibacterium minor TaxID=2316528 RepID=A0A4Q2UAJ6_9HYPH|nr:hypothetical protein [Lichenibacterium minor]RYC33582.1 hypothetical protein D3273_03730 [Lichenibacterium minor]
MADAKRRIGVGEDVINALVDGGAVAAVRTHVPLDGRQVRAVSAADVDRLASLDHLARETTRPTALLRSLLEAMGVEPVFRGEARGEVARTRRCPPSTARKRLAEAGVRPVRDTRRNPFTLYRRSEVVGCVATHIERASDPTASTRGRRPRSSDGRGRP